jgi:DNA transformation protein
VLAVNRAGRVAASAARGPLRFGVSNDDLRDLVCDALAPLPVEARSMFGGYGLYLEDAFFGVISEGRLYLRTDEASRADYVARGMPALQPKHRPRGPRTVDRNFEAPPDVVSDRELLREWALRASRAAPRR